MREHLTFCDPEVLEKSYLTEFLSQGRVPQNLFYLLNGANVFYSYRNSDVAEIAWREEVAFFQGQNLWRPDQSLAFISLGCGNAAPEKSLLHQLHAEGCDVHYIGVDSSARMLELAAENLGDEHFQQSLVLADFGRPDFKAQLDAITASAGTRVYAMIGGTFGNFNQAFLADLLSKLVVDGDYLYLDVVPLESTSERNTQLRDRLAHLPNNLAGFFLQLLAALGLTLEQGTIISEQLHDEVMQTIRYTFCFQVTDAMVVSCLGQQLNLSPGQRIELMTIRAYDIPSLIRFLGTYGFDLVDEHTPDVGRLSHRWHRLLFAKTRMP